VFATSLFYVRHLTATQVSGFTDVAPVVREQTVKAVLTIIGKLSDRTINGELLKYLAKTSNDEQPGIRTNTTICLGKISKNLGVSTRSKVLIAAFTRSLRDPFVHARNAALMALAVTSDAFSEDDCANRILPALCPSLIDKEKLIRDQANKTMDVYLQRIRKFASTMADTALPPTNPTEISGQAPRMSTPQPSEAASWTGWAISSFTNKVSAAAGEITPTANAAPRPSSAPLAADRRPAGTASASALHRQAVTSPPAATTPTSTSSHANDYFHDSNAGGDEEIDLDDAWGEPEEDSFFDAPSEAPKASKPITSAANPFDDDGEPDFAGWLAAQAGKKTTGKPLPKGLAKSSNSNGRPAPGTRVATTGSIGGTGAKRAASTSNTKPAAKPVVAKKIDTAPKDTGEDDGWGDGW
jgi:SCY1-like protein 1